MNDDGNKTVTLNMKIEDILDAVTRTEGKPISESAAAHIAEGEDLKKAWFKYMLSSMEKLNDLVEAIRRVDIVNLKTDLKEDCRKAESRIDKIEQQVRDNRKEIESKVDKLDKDLTAQIDRSHRELLDKITEVNRDLQAYKLRVDTRFNVADKEIEQYKKEVIEPLKIKILTISVKLGVWATIAGLIGSGIGIFSFYLARIFIFRLQ